MAHQGGNLLDYFNVILLIVFHKNTILNMMIITNLYLSYISYLCLGYHLGWLKYLYKNYINDHLTQLKVKVATSWVLITLCTHMVKGATNFICEIETIYYIYFILFYKFPRRVHTKGPTYNIISSCIVHYFILAPYDILLCMNIYFKYKFVNASWSNMCDHFRIHTHLKVEAKFNGEICISMSFPI